MLLCGNSDLDWKDFADAISLFNLYETDTRDISRVMMSQGDYDFQPDYFGSIPALGAARLVEVTDNLFEPGTGKRFYHRTRLQSLEYLVSTFTPFNASEARDTIYAILAIARDSTPRTEAQYQGPHSSIPDTQNPEFQIHSKKVADILKTGFAAIIDKHSRSKPYHVDYSLPISNVYVDFVRFSIERAASLDPARALDILCRPWAPDPDIPPRGRGDTSHGHWRAAFGFRKGLDGGAARDAGTDAHIPQSRREPVLDLANYDIVEHPSDSAKWDYITDPPKWIRVDHPVTNRVESLDTLPSWIPSTSRCPFAWNKKSGEDRKMTRVDADPLVGDPNSRVYAASGKRGVELRHLRFEDGVIIDSSSRAANNSHYHSLYVGGFILGKVQNRRERSQGGQIPKNWAELIEEDEDDGDDTQQDDSQQDLWSRAASEDFWRTLVGDRGTGAPNPPRCIRRILSSYYQPNSDLDLKDTIFYSKHQPAASFSRHIHAVIWNRRMIKMRRAHNSSDGAHTYSLPADGIYYDGYNIGLAPSDTEEGDLVCILYGCSVPVILRPYRKSDSVVKSQLRQQKIKAAQRIIRWWAGYRVAKQLDKLAEALAAELESKKTQLSRQTTQDISEHDATPTKNKSTYKSKGGKGSGRKRKKAAPTSVQEPSTKRIRFDSSSEPQATAGASRTPTTPVRRTTSHYEDAEPSAPAPTTDRNVFYRLIGECYIHRMMRGEAIDHQVENKLPSILFEIR